MKPGDLRVWLKSWGDEEWDRARACRVIMLLEEVRTDPLATAWYVLFEGRREMHFTDLIRTRSRHLRATEPPDGMMGAPTKEA